MTNTDDDFVIVTKLRVDDEVGGGIGTAQRKLDRFERSGVRVGASLTSALGGAFAALGGGMLFGGAVRGIISMNGELEQANAGMATLLSGIAQMPIADAIGVARNQVKGLREDAAEGVGELSDYMRAFQMMLGPGLTGGASLDQLRTLTRTSLAAGFAQRGTPGLEQAPMDIVQALTSGVNDRQTPIALSALQAINVEASKFNQLNMVDKIDTLTRAFGAFDEGVALMGQTWDAQTATLRDGVRSLLQQLTAPLFERWSEHLREANGWLEANRDQLEEIVSTWGQRMLQVWDALIGKVQVYGSLLAGAAIAPAVPALAVAGRAGAATLGGAGLALGAALRDPFGMERVFAKGLGQSTAGLTGGLAPTVGSGLTAIGGALARIVAPIAIATTLFLSMKGALDEFPGVLTFLQGAWSTLMVSLDQLAGSFGLLNGRGSLLNLAGVVLVGVLGGLLYAFSFGVKVIATLTTGIATFFRVLGAGLEGLWNAVMRREDPFATLKAAALEGNQQLSDIWTDWKPPALPELPEVGGDGVGDPSVARNVTNINGPISVVIKAETMDDPARVAVTMDEVFDRVRRQRRQPRRGAGPVFSGA